MSLLFLPQTQGKQTVNFQFWLLIDLMNWWQRHYPSLLGLMIWLPNNVWKKRPDLDLLDVSKLIKKTRENVNTHLQHRKTALLARGSSLADTVYTTNNSFLSLLIEEGNTLTTNILCVCVCGRGGHTYIHTPVMCICPYNISTERFFILPVGRLLLHKYIDVSSIQGHFFPFNSYK